MADQNRWIAFVTTTGTIGGAEMCLLDLLEQGIPQWRTRAILGSNGPLRSAIEALGTIPVDVEPLPNRLAALGDSDRERAGKVSRLVGLASSLASAWRHSSRLANQLRNRATVVQTIDMKSHFLTAIRSASRKSGLVWHLHDYVSNRPTMRHLLRLGLKSRPDTIIAAVSDSVAMDARATLGDRVRIRTIWNGIDLNRFSPKPKKEIQAAQDALDRAVGWTDWRLRERSEHGLRVGLVATFAKWKGHATFLEAAARLRSDWNGRFYVIGGPLYRSSGSQHSMEELRASAQRLGVEDRVGFAGHWDRPEEAITGLDVLVHTSVRPEPFGRTIAEGMACGKAVITTGLGGAGELVVNEESAIVTPPDDAEALANAIERLTCDAATRERLGRAGRSRAEERFDRRRLPSEWSAVYDEAAER